MADLKAVYAAVDEMTTMKTLEIFAQTWDKNIPKYLSHGEPTGLILIPISNTLRHSESLSIQRM